MAIISDEVDLRGHIFENQYIRVDRVNTTKTEMEIEAGVYYSEQSASSGELPHRVHTLHGPFDMHSELNVWQQAYAIAKQRWPEHQDV